MESITLSVISIIISLAALAVSILNSRRSIFAQTFAYFTKRYDDISSKLDDVLSHEVDSDRILMQYLNLCSEEFYCKEVHQIPKDVWLIWEKEMIQKLRRMRARADWPDLVAQIEAYDQFYKWIQKVSALPMSAKSEEPSNPT